MLWVVLKYFSRVKGLFGIDAYRRGFGYNFD